ncbi:MAG: glycosyltransferase family 2 protein [Thermoleophilaceae bacterium]|nr:glycosyltransferase family 2 protein [Thermoleophilaceae bacterium]
MSHEDVTVVIPCFDYGRYVGEAVASALEQEGGAPRLVVVDDGSTDPDTVGVLGRLPPPVTVLRQDNAGPSAARNAGAALTDTPYLLMLDADDRLRPGALDALRAPLDADSSLGFAYGFAEFFGDWTGRLDFPAYDPYRLLHRSIVSATSLLRREAFDAAGGFDPGLPGYEDWDLYLGALESGWTGVRVPEVVLSYRRHSGSRVGSDRAGYRRRYRAIRKKHSALYARAGELAEASELGPAGRLAYRAFWGWRPVPARVENAVYGRVFRRRAAG